LFFFSGHILGAGIFEYQVMSTEQYRRQALEQRKQQILGRQAAPPFGSPEYIALVSRKVSAETDAAKKYILAPAAVVESIGVGVAIAVPEGAAAAKAGWVYAASHPRQVTDFAQGFVNGFARSPASWAGKLGGIAGNIVKSLLP
jgi:hypothetical protein